MKIGRLILRELAHRKWSAAVALLSVAIAVGCLIGALALLKADTLVTQRVLDARREAVNQAVAAEEAKAAAAGKDLEDAMRKITKELGFNILILPEDQDLGEFNVDGTITKTMPASYVEKIAESDIVTINHLLPLVTAKVEWKEIGDSVIVAGTKGEVPIVKQSQLPPLLDAVAPGQMVIGYHLNAKHNRKKGDQVQFLGREFTIVDQNAERGTVDDSTVWINLGEAQELLGKQNLVSAILALECNCASKERVAEIRRDIARILPGTQVIERGPPALARAEARNKAKKTADELVKTAAAEGQAAIAREAEGRQEIETRHAQLASILAPLVIVACAAWIGLLAYGNVRQRASEIGILRAIGARSAQILWLFLGRFLLVGICGAFLGYTLGMLVGTRGYLTGLGDATIGSAAAFRQLFAPEWLLLAIAVAPILAALAAWIPALLASRQDPAAILQEN